MAAVASMAGAAAASAASMTGAAAASMRSMAGAAAASVRSMAGAAAASAPKVTLGPDVLVKQNSGIDEGLRQACIASGLLSLRKGKPNRVKIEGLPDTVEFDTFTYTKKNLEGKVETFGNYSFASEIIDKLTNIRIKLQKKNNNPTRYTYGDEEYCALALLHCRSLPGKIGGLATGCIIPVNLQRGKKKANPSADETASGETKEHTDVPENGLMVRGHGKFIDYPLWITAELSKNVHFRTVIGQRGRKLDRFVDIGYYSNWIKCSIKYALEYYNRKTEDLIRVEHIDLLDIYGDCEPELDREGSAAARSLRVTQKNKLRRSNSTTVDPRIKRRRTNNQEENRVSTHLIGGTVKRKRRKRKTRKR